MAELPSVNNDRDGIQIKDIIGELIAVQLQKAEFDQTQTALVGETEPSRSLYDELKDNQKVLTEIRNALTGEPESESKEQEEQKKTTKNLYDGILDNTNVLVEIRDIAQMTYDLFDSAFKGLNQTQENIIEGVYTVIQNDEEQLLLEDKSFKLEQKRDRREETRSDTEDLIGSRRESDDKKMPVISKPGKDKPSTTPPKNDEDNRSFLGKLISGTLKTIAAIGGLTAGLDIFENIATRNDPNATEEDRAAAGRGLIGQAAGGTTGAITGSIAGAKIGGVIGTIFGPIGTAAGALIGSQIGRVGGGIVGILLGDEIAKEVGEGDWLTSITDAFEK